ncbi:MAG: cobalt ECF transporter T component CbiQ [bacterium]
MFEEYLKGNSIIHKLDPRIKILYAFFFSLVIALVYSIPAALVGLTISILLIIFTKIELKKIIKRLLLINEFILILWLILPLTYPGEQIFKVLGISVTKQGIIFASLLTIKCNAIMLIFIAFLSTSNIFELVHALRHLAVPDKLTVLFFLIYRYSYIVFEQYEKIMRAIKSRGFTPNTSIHTYRTIGYILGGLLVKSHDRAENIYRAMVCRGFDGRFWLFDHFRLSPLDIFACVVLTIANLLIIIVQWKGIPF